MVTDHSTIGFEFCLLDRPLVVFDAPDLTRARINPEQFARCAARRASSAALTSSRAAAHDAGAAAGSAERRRRRLA